jgi:hypothetical protein
MLMMSVSTSDSVTTGLLAPDTAQCSQVPFWARHNIVFLDTVADMITDFSMHFSM